MSLPVLRDSRQTEGVRIARFDDPSAFLFAKMTVEELPDVRCRLLRRMLKAVEEIGVRLEGSEYEEYDDEEERDEEIRGDIGCLIAVSKCLPPVSGLDALRRLIECSRFDAMNYDERRVYLVDLRARIIPMLERLLAEVP